MRTSVRGVRSRPRFPAEPTDLTAFEDARLKPELAFGGAKYVELHRTFDETTAKIPLVSENPSTAADFGDSPAAVEGHSE